MTFESHRVKVFRGYEEIELDICLQLYTPATPGEYKNVFYIHGAGSYPEFERPAIDALLTGRVSTNPRARRFPLNVYAVHLIGHGLSGGMRGVLSADENLQMLDQILPFLPDRFAIVGHSFGGLLAYQWAEKSYDLLKDRVSRIALLSPFFDYGESVLSLIGRLNIKLLGSFLIQQLDALFKLIPAFETMNVPIDYPTIGSRDINLIETRVVPYRIYLYQQTLYSLFNAAKHQFEVIEEPECQLPLASFYYLEDQIVNPDTTAFVTEFKNNANSFQAYTLGNAIFQLVSYLNENPGADTQKRYGYVRGVHSGSGITVPVGTSFF